MSWSIKEVKKQNKTQTLEYKGGVLTEKSNVTLPHICGGLTKTKINYKNIGENCSLPDLRSLKGFGQRRM